MSTTKRKTKGRRATKTPKRDLPPAPLALFPSEVPRGYVRVREHLRKVNKRRKG